MEKYFKKKLNILKERFKKIKILRNQNWFSKKTEKLKKKNELKKFKFEKKKKKLK